MQLTLSHFSGGHLILVTLCTKQTLIKYFAFLAATEAAQYNLQSVVAWVASCDLNLKEIGYSFVATTACQQGFVQTVIISSSFI